MSDKLPLRARVVRGARTPKALKWIHTFLLAGATGALTYASGAFATGIKGNFWHDMLIGAGAAAASRILGAALSIVQQAQN